MLLKKKRMTLQAKCNKCDFKLSSKTKDKDLRSMGMNRRTHYHFGKKSKGRTTIHCSCGGIFIEGVKKQEQ